MGVSIARTLGLDVGDKRIGLALSDPDGILASPLTIINRSDAATDIEAILSIINQYKVGKIVVGLPRSMDGSLGKQAGKVQAFTQQLCNHIEVAVEFRDERLTTVEAQRLLHAVNARKNRQKLRDDAIAAALILQSYLDEGC